MNNETTANRPISFLLSRSSQANSGFAASENLSSIPRKFDFAVPWYQNPNRLLNAATNEKYPFTGQQLYAAEVQQMRQHFPQAKKFFLPDGLLYWLLPLKIDIGKRAVNYTLMLRYDNNHPHPHDWGGSCKTIFISPTVDDLNRRARAKHGKGAPHILSLPNARGEYYLCAISKDEQADMMKTGNVQGAAAVAARAMRYAYMFEVGMEDLTVWQELCRG